MLLAVDKGCRKQQNSCFLALKFHFYYMQKLSVQSLGFSLPFLSLSLFLSLHCTFPCSVIPWNISQSWSSHSSSPFFPVPSQLCVLHNLSCFHGHVFISLHPFIYSLSNLLILDSEHTLTLLMLQSPPCFDDAYGFQLPSPMYVPDCFSSAATLSAPLGYSVSREAWMTCISVKIPFLSLPTWWQN